MKVIDKAVFIDSFHYFDRPIVVEIIDIFLNDYFERLSTIKNAIETKDFAALKFNAHSLKGVIANFVADVPRQLAYQLEIKGTNQDGTDLDSLFSELQLAIADLIEDLKELKEEYLKEPLS